MKDPDMLERARESRRLMQIYNTMFRYVMEFALDIGLLGAFRRRMQQFLYRPPQRVVPLSTAVSATLNASMAIRIRRRDRRSRPMRITFPPDSGGD